MKKKKSKRTVKTVPKKAVETIAVEPTIKSVDDGKTIRVACEGAGLADLDELTPLQGGLKTLSPDDYGKLKASILKHGISFPLFAWKNDGALYTIDGHQRDKVLAQMRKEGYRVPKLPVAYIHAADKKEALEKILLVSSQYGKITEDSFYQFIAGNLDFNELLPLIEFPQLDLKALQKTLLDQDDAARPGVTVAPAQFFIIVECSDKSQQAALFERFVDEGLCCRISSS